MSQPPEYELRVLQLTIVDAATLANDGRPGDGYRALLEGLSRMQDLQDAGQPWAQELVNRWWEACEAHARQWGVGVGQADPGSGEG